MPYGLITLHQPVVGTSPAHRRRACEVVAGTRMTKLENFTGFTSKLCSVLMHNPTTTSRAITSRRSATSWDLMPDLFSPNIRVRLLQQLSIFMTKLTCSSISGGVTHHFRMCVPPTRSITTQFAVRMPQERKD